MYSLAIFDFDGTLVDSTPAMVETMKIVTDENRLTDHILERWRSLVGLPISRQMEALFPDKDEQFHNRIIANYRSLYNGNNIKNCPLFPGTIKVLESLKRAGVTISIASSKPKKSIEEVLNHHNLVKYFSLVIGAQEVTNHKPHPESVHITLSKLDISPVKAIVVGDSLFDLQMARVAGVDSIGITTGPHTYERLLEEKPKHIFTSLEQVLSVIVDGKENQPGKF
jgi:phosphoglycolate phosphatase